MITKESIIDTYNYIKEKYKVDYISVSFNTFKSMQSFKLMINGIMWRPDYSDNHMYFYTTDHVTANNKPLGRYVEILTDQDRIIKEIIE